MPGPNRLEPTPEPLSQTQEYGMAPVYQTMRNGPDRLLGYRFDQATAAQQGKLDVPKPPSILAAEQQLGLSLIHI